MGFSYSWFIDSGNVEYYVTFTYQMTSCKELTLNHLGENNGGGAIILFLNMSPKSSRKVFRGEFLWPKAQDGV